MSMKKLQTEIDRVLKKVTEGVETFETIFEKIQSSSNANQKEKYEQDLKKEIKKLQRLRDQIKTWISSNEIKDKRALVENRKLIESQMERFKAIEKEMKTKAYSKEGLMQQDRLDPKEVEKRETCEWVSEMVDELSRQNETIEFELETLQSTSRKGKKDQRKAGKVNDLEHNLERNSWHINRLELILRLLENDHLESGMVDEIKDDVAEYVKDNQDPTFDENEYIYDLLNLEEEEELYAIQASDLAEALEREEERPASKAPSTAPTSPVASKSTTTVKSTAAVVTPSQSTTTTTASTPAAATAATVVASTSATTTALPQSASVSPSSTAATPLATTIASPTTSATPVDLPAPPHPISTGLKYAQVAAVDPAKDSSPVSAWVEPPKIIDQPKKSPQQQQAKSSSQPLLSSQYTDQNATTEWTSGASGQEFSAARLPPSLADLGQFLESVKARASRENLPYVRTMLEASMNRIPDLQDSERPGIPYSPKNPNPKPNPGYPTEPLLFKPSLVEKFDTDLLFFMFYYQKGTYLQHLAARELKKQAWRFHKQNQNWYQRHEEPKVITEDYEQGTYTYFDYGEAWRKTTKSDFRFEYKYLEEA